MCLRPVSLLLDPAVLTARTLRSALLAMLSRLGRVLSSSTAVIHGDLDGLVYLRCRYRISNESTFCKLPL